MRNSFRKVGLGHAPMQAPDVARSKPPALNGKRAHAGSVHRFVNLSVQQLGRTTNGEFAQAFRVLIQLNPMLMANMATTTPNEKTAGTLYQSISSILMPINTRMQARP